jgi:hypothetical protein
LSAVALAFAVAVVVVVIFAVVVVFAIALAVAVCLRSLPSQLFLQLQLRLPLRSHLGKPRLQPWPSQPGHKKRALALGVCLLLPRQKSVISIEADHVSGAAEKSISPKLRIQLQDRIPQLELLIHLETIISMHYDNVQIRES